MIGRTRYQVSDNFWLFSFSMGSVRANVKAWSDLYHSVSNDHARSNRTNELAQGQVNVTVWPNMAIMHIDGLTIAIQTQGHQKQKLYYHYLRGCWPESKNLHNSPRWPLRRPRSKLQTWPWSVIQDTSFLGRSALPTKIYKLFRFVSIFSTQFQ